MSFLSSRKKIIGQSRNNIHVPSKETDLKKLYPWVWGDHTYKSPLGHAYTRTHKYCKFMLGNHCYI